MRAFLTIFLFLASVQAALAQATISSVSSSPGQIRVNPNGAATVQIRWRVSLNFTGPLPETISSASGITNTGNPLGGALSRTVQSNGGTASVTIVESLYIDRTSAEEIGRLGAGTYNRVFGTSLGTNPVSLALRPSSSGALAMRNLDLTFDDGTRSRVVAPGTALTARLEVSSVGRGQFAGRWEIAGPGRTIAFRSFGRSSVRLSGARRTVLESPPLRTDRPGLYRVRFVPDTVRADVDRTPVREISYTVAVGAGDPGAGLRLIAPEPGQDLTGSVRFAWESVAGAVRYRVEFSEPAATGFATNALAAVDVDDPSVRLRGFTVARLATAKRLSWRVTAYDAAGRVLARSPLRTLR